MSERMSRREMLACSGGWLAMIGLGASIVRGPRDTYVPTGHLTVDMAAARNVDHVTLDGQRIDRVFELDDVEGWLRHYVRGADDKIIVDDLKRGILRVARRTGVVRVHWKERPS